MTAETDMQIQAKTPAFLGLQSYTEAQAVNFFGRDTEIDTLAQLVLINNLTIVFGKSGTGKTSLLNAGVFPRLRKNYCLPFRIRLEFKENSPDLITQIKKVLQEEIDKYGFKVQSYPGPETLWEYFHKEPLWKTVMPILVFDQFEEMFTLANTNSRFGTAEMNLFWEELSNLIENTIPKKLKTTFLEEREKITYNYKKQKTKTVFAFREEYLPEFESIAVKIPSIKYSRFRLMPMNGHQAYDVITKTWKQNINPSEARQIVSYLTNQSEQESYDLITIEPSLLSQVCAHIDEKRIEEGGNKVSAELLKKYSKETILRSIYDEAITAADLAVNPGAHTEAKTKKNPVKEFLEDKLITTEGFRTKYNLSEKDNLLRPGIGVLQSKYFIREDDNVVELTHDVLAPIIKSDREERRRKNALSARFRKAIRVAVILIFSSLLVAGALWGFAIKKKIVAEQKAKKAEKTYLDYTEKYNRFKDSISKSTPALITKPPQPLVDNSASEKERYIRELLKYIEGLESAIQSLKGMVAKLNMDIDSLEHIQPDHLRDNGEMTRLNNEIDQLRRESAIQRKTIDQQIADLDSLKGENQRLITENNKLLQDNARLSKEKEELIRENSRLISENAGLNNEKEKLLQDNARLSKEKEELVKENTRLVSENDRLSKDNDLKSRLIKELELQMKTCCKPTASIDQTNSIQLSIYYTGTQKNYPGISPEKINVYLIPYKGNGAIIKKASDYYSYNETELEKATGIIKAKYSRADGDYYFENVTEEGKYLLKVCTLYGAYKEYELKKGGNPHITIDASPPVR